MVVQVNDATSGKRRYASSRRAKDMAERRDTIVATAAALLREHGGAAKLSLEHVARASGVTRLTVYNQFGSRQGLLEAVAEVLAQSGRMARLADVAREPDAETGLEMLVHIFCQFWTGDAAVGSVREAISADPDVAAALASRLSSRRELVSRLVARLRPEWDGARQENAVDLIRVLIDHPSVIALSTGRGSVSGSRLILEACRAAVALPTDDIHSDLAEPQ